jgi:hypothetical protein
VAVRARFVVLVAFSVFAVIVFSSWSLFFEAVSDTDL